MFVCVCVCTVCVGVRVCPCACLRARVCTTQTFRPKCLDQLVQQLKQVQLNAVNTALHQRTTRTHTHTHSTCDLCASCVWLDVRCSTHAGTHAHTQNNYSTKNGGQKDHNLRPAHSSAHASKHTHTHTHILPVHQMLGLVVVKHSHLELSLQPQQNLHSPSFCGCVR